MLFARSLFAAAALTLLTYHPAIAAKRVALVIGNSAYVTANPLANPANDANDMATKLEKLGFDVIKGLNLNKAGFDAKVRDFAGALESADSAILFYAGHGLQVAGNNYLVPIDAKLEKERDLEFEAVRLDFILKQMELGREDKTNIVFLDACRDNPLSRSLARNMGTRSASIGKGLAQIDAGVGTFISYSTQPGNVALDGDGRNSPFTAALVKRIEQGGDSLTSVMIDVRKDVIASTSGKQVPWDHSALTGEFFFDPNAKGGETGALQSRVKQLEDEVKAKGKSANVATTAALTQLRQRVKEMERETRRDRDRLFEVQRSQISADDMKARIRNIEEIGRLQRGMTERGRDRAELEAEIKRLETELGVAGNETKE
jgi:uncharacterized caspase-like protein